MADSLTPSERSNRMGRIRGTDTRPEKTVRSLLHALGFRFRLHRKDLPGRPDIVFSRRKKVVFVHGCFWHRHADPLCPLARLPKSRLDFWLPKLEANRVRDVRHQSELDMLGWKHLIVWECELRHTEQCTNKLLGFLAGNDINESD